MHEHRAALTYLRPRLIHLCFQRLHACPRRFHRCDLGIIGCLALIEILFRDQAILEKTLSAVVIQPGFLQVSLLREQIRLCYLKAGFRNLHARLCRIDCR